MDHDDRHAEELKAVDRKVEIADNESNLTGSSEL
jgi:hypothetical protein